MKVLFIEKGEEKKYIKKDGRFAINPTEFNEGFGFNPLILKDENYKFCWELLKDLPIKEVTAIEYKEF